MCGKERSFLKLICYLISYLTNYFLLYLLLASIKKTERLNHRSELFFLQNAGYGYITLKTIRRKKLLSLPAILLISLERHLYSSYTVELQSHHHTDPKVNH